MFVSWLSKLFQIIFFLFTTPIVDGGWTSWTIWANCSHSCGNGTHTRARSCENPFPIYGGKLCLGKSSEEKLCFQKECPGTSILNLLNGNVLRRAKNTDFYEKKNHSRGQHSLI